MGAWFENGRKAMLARHQKERRANHERSKRYFKSYGDTDQYKDMVRATEMLDRIIATLKLDAFRAHDCLGGEDEIRAILAEVCDPPKDTT